MTLGLRRLGLQLRPEGPLPISGCPDGWGLGSEHLGVWWPLFVFNGPFLKTDPKISPQTCSLRCRGCAGKWDYCMRVSASEPRFPGVYRKGSGQMLPKEPPGSVKIIIISWKNKIKWRF